MSTANVSALSASKRSLEISLAAIIAVSVLLIFWSQQRYPALMKKFHSGTHLTTQGPLSFDAIVAVSPEMPPATRVLRTGTNWMYTNRFGMLFAVSFGAAMMTLLAYTRIPTKFSSAAGNVLCGAAVGAPMGICSNCASPVGRGLLARGTSSRLTVAAMISSPSLNPIVLAMAFVLFPLPLAMIRLIVPIALLAMLPILVPEIDRKSIGIEPTPLTRNMSKRIGMFFVKFLENLARLTLHTLPWMLLAALVGALVGELIPAYGTHIPVSLLGIVCVAILGTLLPMPIAFDIALAYVLYHAGISTVYIAVLLSTLGPVSVMSLSVLGHELGHRISLKLGGATAILGCIAGLVMTLLH